MRRFFRKLGRRLKEPSSFAGYAAIATGAAMIHSDRAGQTVAAGTEVAAEAIEAATVGGWEVGVTVGLLGLLAILRGEKGTGDR